MANSKLDGFEWFLGCLGTCAIIGILIMFFCIMAHERKEAEERNQRYITVEMGGDKIAFRCPHCNYKIAKVGDWKGTKYTEIKRCSNCDRKMRIDIEMRKVLIGN